MTTKNRAELIQDLANTIKNRDRAIETGFGPVKDIVIDPVSLVARDIYTQLQRVFDIQFLKNAEKMTTEELDLLGESLGIKRKGPVRATGSVFFVTSSKPTSDITIPQGFPVSTSSIVGVKSVQTFVTTRTVTLFAASADAFFNPQAGVFEVETLIRALTPGDDGRVAAGTITQLQRQIPGVSAVVNKSATFGGKDSETNLEYARRIRLALLGTDRGTLNGLRRFSLNDDRVIDALVIMAGDPLIKRTEGVAGAVDVYILGEEATIVRQTEVFDGLDIAIETEPLVFPNPISSIIGTVVGPLTENVHFFLITDPILVGSAKARDVIRFNRSAQGLPAIGEQITIEYVADKLISDLQTRLEAVENNVLADVAFRKATQVDIVLEVEVKVTPDVSIDTLSDRIRSAIRSFVNTRGLGEDIVPSDLDLVIRSIPGVDFVVLPFDRLSKDDEQGSNIVAIEKNEFANITDANIVLTLST
ncbi:MAG: baseplate J/gp47 family protein [Nitrososphaera sp.]|nr:baseplate J/gp47 family protein [Nitrososphaera sp.]